MKKCACVGGYCEYRNHKRSLIEQVIGIAEGVKTLSERVKMSFYTYIAFVNCWSHFKYRNKIYYKHSTLIYFFMYSDAVYH